MRSRRTLNSHAKRIVAARARWTCEVCHSLLDETYEIDHVVPLHRGGADDLDNLQACCASCHRKKTAREELHRQTAAKQAKGRSPLSCVRCQHVLSPYFAHAHSCPPNAPPS